MAGHRSFNLRREANPLATRVTQVYTALTCLFQSQARSQSPGDSPPRDRYRADNQCFNLRREANPLATINGLSIAVEHISFNLRREANPLATPVARAPWVHFQSFNLRREANPLATCHQICLAAFRYPFQSQARSQSPGDGMAGDLAEKTFEVSISGEKPIPWRPASSRSISPISLSVSISGEKPIPWRPQM